MFVTDTFFLCIDTSATRIYPHGHTHTLHDALPIARAGTTALGETCQGLALAALETEFAQRHGVISRADGHVQRLVVFALGKLCGGELKFSSDVDLVYGYEEDGESEDRKSTRLNSSH